EVLGPVLGAALQSLAPVFVEVLTALEPILPILGEALISALQQLTPSLLLLVQTLAPLLPVLAQMVVDYLPSLVMLFNVAAAAIAVTAHQLRPLLDLFALLTGWTR